MIRKVLTVALSAALLCGTPAVAQGQGGNVGGTRALENALPVARSARLPAGAGLGTSVSPLGKGFDPRASTVGGGTTGTGILGASPTVTGALPPQPAGACPAGKRWRYFPSLRQWYCQ